MLRSLRTCSLTTQSLGEIKLYGKQGVWQQTSTLKYDVVFGLGATQNIVFSSISVLMHYDNRNKLQFRLETPFGLFKLRPTFIFGNFLFCNGEDALKLDTLERVTISAMPSWIDEIGRLPILYPDVEVQVLFNFLVSEKPNKPDELEKRWSKVITDVFGDAALTWYQPRFRVRLNNGTQGISFISKEDNSLVEVGIVIRELLENQ